VLDLCVTFEATMVLFRSGRVRIFGSNSGGALGLGSDFDLIVGDNEPPTDVPPLNLVNGSLAESITCGNFHACVVLRDGGGVVCWGEPIASGRDCRNGGVCDPVLASTIPPIEFPPGTGRIVQAAASDENTCFLEALPLGRVICVGYLPRGALGWYQFASSIRSPVDSRFVGLEEPAIEVSAGTGFGCALLQSLTVRCWGVGTSGQLGNGLTTTIGDDEAVDSVPPVIVGNDF